MTPEQLQKLDAMAKPRSEESIKKAEERKKQHSKLIQGLQDYLDNTSPEQLEKDLQELEQFNQYGPDMEECLELGRQHCMEMMKELDMNKEDYIKIGEDSIRCYECAFCEDCEDRFKECIANYQHEGKCVHLKSCEYLHWNTMSDEEKAFFLQECLPHEYKK